MHTNFEKIKVPQAVSGSFAKSGCSVRYMLCTMFVPLFLAKILEKQV